MERILKTYKKKLFNKRIYLAFDNGKKTFIIRFTRLIETGEIIEETPKLCTCRTEILKNKIVITTLEVQKESFMCLLFNFYDFYEDFLKCEYPNFSV